METITLEGIKQEQTKLADMIANFEALNGARNVRVPHTDIRLAAGEHYAGIVLNQDGSPNHHLILLPGEATDTNWADAKQWAQEAGGQLPQRNEQALLYANLKDQFEVSWYWSAVPHASHPGFAWCQGFGYGGQDDSHKGNELRARAVRRLTI